MRGRVVLSAVLAGATLLAAAGCGSDAKPAADDSATSLHGVLPQALNVRELSLPDVTTGAAANARFAFKAAPGRVVALYFGYTHCPDICPTTMGDIAKALKQLRQTAAAKVDVAFATVDVERDTPAVLNDWLAHFFAAGRVRALRASGVPELMKTEYRLDVDSQVVKGTGTKANEITDVGHTTVMLLIDDQGNVRTEWPNGVTSADMRSDLARLTKA